MFKSIIAALAALLLLLLVAVLGAAYFYNNMLEPVEPEATEEYSLVDIPPGASTEFIAAILYDQGLIQNELAFRFYVRHHDLAQDFMAGQYHLSPSMDVEEIISRIQLGEVYAETAWFTIPEGYTVEQIADRLEQKALVEKDQFLKIASDPPSTITEDFPFLKEIQNPDIDYLLEGYFYPETYEVYTDAGAEDIVRLMLNQMDKTITDRYKEQMSERDLTLHEVLTHASLVEREARVDHERAPIAGVIFNRLEIGQRLEIDATIQYVLDETKEFLTYDDLEVSSPYNTYRNDGLPPGPIAAPGEPSIKAVLYPEDNEYFYYNYKYDNSGEHYFSKTYEEHMNNVRRAEENLD